MSEFRMQKVGSKKFKEHKMPPASEIKKKLKRLWEICWDAKPDWDPLGEFEFHERGDSDPVFRSERFRARPRRRSWWIDLLGRYRRQDSLVTIYIDSCFKAARRYNALLDDLVDVVLIHELAHLVTHRGFGEYDLSRHFMEYTAQCLTYAYLKPNGGEALKVFEDLSEHQPFIYRT